MNPAKVEEFDTRLEQVSDRLANAASIVSMLGMFEVEI